MMKIVGAMLISMPFIAITAFMVKELGVINSIFIWGMVILCVAVISIGVYLLVD